MAVLPFVVVVYLDSLFHRLLPAILLLCIALVKFLLWPGISHSLGSFNRCFAFIMFVYLWIYFWGLIASWMTATDLHPVLWPYGFWLDLHDPAGSARCCLALLFSVALVQDDPFPAAHLSDASLF